MYQSIINSLKNEKAIDAFDMINIYKNRNCKLPVLRPIILMRKFKSNIVLKTILYILTLSWIVLYPILITLKDWVKLSPEQRKDLFVAIPFLPSEVKSFIRKHVLSQV